MKIIKNTFIKEDNVSCNHPDCNHCNDGKCTKDKVTLYGDLDDGLSKGIMAIACSDKVQFKPKGV